MTTKEYAAKLIPTDRAGRRAFRNAMVADLSPLMRATAIGAWGLIQSMLPLMARVVLEVLLKRLQPATRILESTLAGETVDGRSPEGESALSEFTTLMEESRRGEIHPATSALLEGGEA